MLISVIVPVLNAAETLEQCIQSVVSQSLADKELIIVDGGSTDGSKAIIESFGDKIAFYSSQPDRGVFDAYNKGIRHASGDWIYFFGADDFLASQEVLHNVAQYLASAKPEIRVVYGQVALLGKNDQVLRLLGEPWHVVRRKLAAFMPISHQGVFHRKCLFEEHGLFDPSFKLAGDYEFLLRELQSHEAQFIPDAIIAAHRSGGLSGKPENEIRTMRELRRAQRMRGITFPRPAWVVRMSAAWLQRVLSMLLGQKVGSAATDILRRLAGKSRHWTRIN
jgi:glycosyltransferase involved in cell wall biosynthesis